MSLIFNPAFISRRLPHVKTPTTWNPSDKASGVTLSNGNLTAATPNAGGSAVRTVVSAASHKHYFEITVDAVTAAGVALVGVATSGLNISTDAPGYEANGYSYRANGAKINNSVNTAGYGATYGAGDVISVLLDQVNNTIEFWKNGASQGIAYSSIAAGPFFAAIGDNSSGANCTFTANFGQSPFVYERPWDYWGGLGTI